MSFFVYILYSEKFDKYYIGQTNSIDERLKSHNSKKVQSTAPYVPWILVMYITKETRSESMGLEKKIKNLNRAKLLSFIEKYGSDSKGRNSD